MAEEKDLEREKMSDQWGRNWEDQVLDDFESEAVDLDDRLQADSEQASQKLWASFQTSATSIAQLYKDRHQGLSLWIPFQNSASSVTVLYKDSIEAQRKTTELAVHNGMIRKTKDILSWAKKRKRHIRREDLIAYLCGKAPPPRHRMSPPRLRLSPPRSRSSNHGAPLEPITEGSMAEPDLHTFREALALQGLNGAMSNINMGYGAPPGVSTSKTARTNNVDDLNRFINEEIYRNCGGRKRSSAPDVRMDSPSRKRGRLF